MCLVAFAAAKIGVSIQEASPLSGSLDLAHADGVESTSTLCLSKPSVVGSTDQIAAAKSLGSLNSQDSLSNSKHNLAVDGKRTPPPLLPKPKRDLMTKDIREVPPAPIDSAKVVSPDSQDALKRQLPIVNSVQLKTQDVKPLTVSVHEATTTAKTPPVPLTPSPVSQGMPPAVPLRSLAKNPAFQFFDSLAAKGPPPLPRAVTCQPLSPARRKV